MKDNLELEKDDISIDPQIEVDDENLKQINFMVDAWFDVDKKFGININDEESTWLNIWGFYNPFEDTLKLNCQISRDTGSDWFVYEPTAEEATFIKDMVAKKIEKIHHQTPQEFCQSVWDEEESLTMGGI